MKITRPLFFLLITFGTLSKAVQQESDSSGRSPTFYFQPEIRGIQIDGTIFLFTYTGSFFADIDVIGFKQNKKVNVGTRFGVEHIVSGNVGGMNLGSPFTDYNTLLRLTSEGEKNRMDFFGGYAYSTSGKSANYFSEWLPKFGIEARWKIGTPAFGILGKLSGTKTHGTIGIGIYFDWENP